MSQTFHRQLVGNSSRWIKGGNDTNSHKAHRGPRALGTLAVGTFASVALADGPAPPPDPDLGAAAAVPRTDPPAAGGGTTSSGGRATSSGGGTTSSGGGTTSSGGGTTLSVPVAIPAARRPISSRPRPAPARSRCTGCCRIEPGHRDRACAGATAPTARPRRARAPRSAAPPKRNKAIDAQRARTARGTATRCSPRTPTGSPRRTRPRSSARRPSVTGVTAVANGSKVLVSWKAVGRRDRLRRRRRLGRRCPTSPDGARARPGHRQAVCDGLARRARRASSVTRSSRRTAPSIWRHRRRSPRSTCRSPRCGGGHTNPITSVATRAPRRSTRPLPRSWAASPSRC